MITLKQYSFPRRHTGNTECNLDYYVNSTDIEHMTFVLIPKETQLIKRRKAGSPDWHATHVCAFARIRADRLEILANKLYVLLHLPLLLKHGPEGPQCTSENTHFHSLKERWLRDFCVQTVFCLVTPHLFGQTAISLLRADLSSHQWWRWWYFA